MANDYQRTKVEALAVARGHRDRGLPLVIAIPGVVYGPGPAGEANLVGRLLTQHRSGRLRAIIGGRRLWSFSFVEDVAAGHVTALQQGEAGTEYALGGENLPQRTVFAYAGPRYGRPTPRDLPLAIARAVGAAEECRARLFRSAPLVTRGAVDIFEHDWPVDSTTAVRDLSYRMRSLRAGLEPTLDDLEGQWTRRARAT
jgi:nucleoside-diphosphate-sugar epimerase